MKLTAFLLLILAAGQLFAQTPRTDDHFWKRKVFYKIDLNEKMNVNLIKPESQLYSKGKYTDTNGMVYSLLEHLQKGDILAYRYDSLSSPMTWNDMLAYQNKMLGCKLPLSENPDEDTDFEPDENVDEPSDVDDEPNDEMNEAVAENSSELSPLQQLVTNSESVIGFIEDRMIDKNKSDTYLDIQYLVVFYSDPSGTFPEEPIACFKYDEVKDLLGNTQYKNRDNDAEQRSIKEIFDLRLFHSFAINLSGYKILDLNESQTRDNQMVQYEHHLWNY